MDDLFLPDFFSPPPFPLKVFVKELANMGIEKAQLGLGHSYSRAKVKFNVNRADNMIIQSIALLDQMDKDINTFAMRVREWYSWHFPELVKIVNDNFVFARCAEFIKHRSSLTEEGKLEGLKEILLDDDKAAAIMHAAKISMGMDVSEVDMINILDFTRRIISLGLYRKQLSEYLHSKMNNVAPNLAALIGDTVAARLISHAGSLTNLAKCPASTVQILGAEKALFRALKTRGNTPKYGLIFHSSFISRATAKNKGRISRYLANKCSIASRIDSFIDEPTTKYGDKMREQVEERLEFYNTGAAPRKNIDVMKVVSDELRAEQKKRESDKDGAKKTKKRKASDAAAAVPADGEKKKKKKKKKSTTPAEPVVATPVAAPAVPAEGEKKKKKKKSNAAAEPVAAPVVAPAAAAPTPGMIKEHVLFN
jgi:nucleolar protein 56